MAALRTRLVFAVVVVCAALLSLAEAQQHYFQGCPKIESVQDLDMEKLSQGSWYEFRILTLQGYSERSPWCSQTTFGRDLTVTTEFFSPYGFRRSLRGHLKNTDSKGSFNITYDNIVTSGELPYNFLSVEYDDFVLIFACYEYDDHTSVSGWLLSRTPTLTRNARDKFDDKFDSLGISFPTVMFHDINRNEDCETDFGTIPPIEYTTTERQTSLVPPSTSPAESTPGSEPTKAPSTPNADHGSTTQTPPQSTISITTKDQGESWGFIQALVLAQWSMFVMVLLLGLFVVVSTLAMYRIVLPSLHARQHDDARTLSFAPSEFSTKKSGHYNDGLEVDV